MCRKDKNGMPIKQFESCTNCKYHDYLRSNNALVCNYNHNIHFADKKDALTCEYFCYAYPEVNNDYLEPDGLPVRSLQGRELLTANAWKSFGYHIREGEKGVMLHSKKKSAVFEYFTFEQVERN